MDARALAEQIVEMALQILEEECGVDMALTCGSMTEEKRIRGIMVVRIAEQLRTLGEGRGH